MILVCHLVLVHLSGLMILIDLFHHLILQVPVGHLFQVVRFVLSLQLDLVDQIVQVDLLVIQVIL